MSRFGKEPPAPAGGASLIGDIMVVDIISEKNSKPHIMTAFAKIQDETITYPAIEI
jgi:hypothetical protein